MCCLVSVAYRALAQVRFSSEYLWRVWVHIALTNTYAFVMEMLGEYLFVQASQIHLCVDVADLDIPRNYERVFVSRAIKERPVKVSQVDKPIYRYHN